MRVLVQVEPTTHLVEEIDDVIQRDPIHVDLGDRADVDQLPYVFLDVRRLEPQPSASIGLVDFVIFDNLPADDERHFEIVHQVAPIDVSDVLYAQ